MESMINKLVFYIIMTQIILCSTLAGIGWWWLEKSNFDNVFFIHDNLNDY